MEIELGPCAQFSIYHLMQLKVGEEGLNLDKTSPGLSTQIVEILGAPLSSTSGRTPLQSTDLDDEVETVKAPDRSKKTMKAKRKDPRTLGDIAKLLRSKNAGPFEVTSDVMFASEAEYQLVKASGILNATSMARLFGIQEDDIVWEGFFDQALAYKVTIPRTRNGKLAASGGYMENDVHASQQYIGLMNMKLPEVLKEQWKVLVEV